MSDDNPKPVEIPDKTYFRIGEVSALANVESYVLRFWETEFKGINPKRTPSGQRLYRRADVELIMEIKKLLHEKKYTIRGAKQYLAEHKKHAPVSPPATLLDQIRNELETIRELLA